MIDLMREILGKFKPGKLEEGRQERDVRVATCALFLEMAGIDGEFGEVEKGGVLDIMKEQFAITDEQASNLLETAREELEGSIDHWHFAKLINAHYSREEKLQVIEMIWRIAYLDGKLDKHEDYLVHKLAVLLRLSHPELIDAKLKVLNGR